MNECEFKNGRAIGSVKAAINKYGGKINQNANTIKKSQNDDASDLEKKTSKARELHVAKNKINQINENRIIAESEIYQAEFELLRAKNFARELTSQIQGSKSRAEEFHKEVRVEQQPAQEKNDRFDEVAREVEVVKRELSKIKLKTEHAVEEKFRAEKESAAAQLRLKSYTCTAENLRREIEEANEEEVLVELAQIQARKELAEIEAKRKEEGERYSFLIKETRNKISVLRDEIKKMKDLEDILEYTNSDIDVLQNELNLIKEMDSRIQRNEKLKKSPLPSVTEDLEAARKELETIKAEVFPIMGSMDIIRKELINISSEKNKFEIMEAEIGKYIKKLNTKILKAKGKLEDARASERNAKSMLPTLSLALENLKTEKEAAKKEEERLKEDTGNIRAEIQKNESENDTKEERLQAIIEELEEVKNSEANTLEKLQALVENAVRARASKTKSTITISKFEYEYLTGCAAGAQEIADKKVAAAHAWAEALMANERELKLKTSLTERKIGELQLKEEQEIKRREELENEAELATEELQKIRKQKNEILQESRSTVEHDYGSTPVRQAKFRRSVGSPATRRMSTSTSLSLKRRRKAMLKVAKYFASEQVESEKSVSLNTDTDN